MPGMTSLARKFMRLGTGLLLVALVSIGLTLWVTWQLEGGAAAVNEAGRMRMQTWRLASVVQLGAPPPEVQRLVGQFDESLRLLRSGDASRPLFVPWDEQVRQRFVGVESLWLAQRQQWLSESRPTVPASLQAADDLVHAIDGLVSTMEQHLSRLTAILNLFQFAMMALAIGAAVLMLYTGYQYVINPLSRLRQGLAQVEAKEFATRIEVDTSDEFCTRSAPFWPRAAALTSWRVALLSACACS